MKLWLYALRSASAPLKWLPSSGPFTPSTEARFVYCQNDQRSKPLIVGGFAAPHAATQRSKRGSRLVPAGSAFQNRTTSTANSMGTATTGTTLNSGSTTGR